MGESTSFNLPTQMYILLLPEDLRDAILERINGKNVVLNMLALVCCYFHSMLAPQGSGCRPAFTRRVVLSGDRMLEVAPFAQPWWSCVQGRNGTGLGVTNPRLKYFALACPQITSLYLSACYQITDEGLISLAGVCTAITTLDLSYCWKIGDAGVEALANGCPALKSLWLTSCAEGQTKPLGVWLSGARVSPP